MKSLLLICVGSFTVIGWLANVWQIVGALDHPVTGAFVVKCIGIFAAPLGVLLGWGGILFA